MGLFSRRRKQKAAPAALEAQETKQVLILLPPEHFESFKMKWKPIEGAAIQYKKTTDFFTPEGELIESELDTPFDLIIMNSHGQSQGDEHLSLINHQLIPSAEYITALIQRNNQLLAESGRTDEVTKFYFSSCYGATAWEAVKASNLPAHFIALGNENTKTQTKDEMARMMRLFLQSDSTALISEQVCGLTSQGICEYILPDTESTMQRIVLSGAKARIEKGSMWKGTEDHVEYYRSKNTHNEALLNTSRKSIDKNTVYYTDEVTLLDVADSIETLDELAVMAGFGIGTQKYDLVDKLITKILPKLNIIDKETDHLYDLLLRKAISSGDPKMIEQCLETHKMDYEAGGTSIRLSPSVFGAYLYLDYKEFVNPDYNSNGKNLDNIAGPKEYMKQLAEKHPKHWAYFALAMNLRLEDFKTFDTILGEMEYTEIPDVFSKRSPIVKNPNRFPNLVEMAVRTGYAALNHLLDGNNGYKLFALGTECLPMKFVPAVSNLLTEAIAAGGSGQNVLEYVCNTTESILTNQPRLKSDLHAQFSTLIQDMVTQQTANTELFLETLCTRADTRTAHLFIDCLSTQLNTSMDENNIERCKYMVDLLHELSRTAAENDKYDVHAATTECLNQAYIYCQDNNVTPAVGEHILSKLPSGAATNASLPAAQQNQEIHFSM